ncbi:hypothetical protein TNCV_1771251 [Trichonephila clavipes]|nr:hypothetical protein TNCV_1771251 [Trichonephila clavipes]
MALRNKDIPMNKMSRDVEREIWRQYIPDGGESVIVSSVRIGLMKSWAEFCGLPMISDERHVVDPPLVFKRVFLAEKRPEELREQREETEKKKEKETREREREEEPALDGEKGLSRDWSGKTMNAGGVENRI